MFNLDFLFLIFVFPSAIHQKESQDSISDIYSLRFIIKKIQSKSSRKMICITVVQRDSTQASNILLFPRPHRVLFVSLLTVGTYVQCICPWKPVRVSNSKVFIGSWSHRYILLCNRLWQTELRTLTMKPGTHP